MNYLQKVDYYRWEVIGPLRECYDELLSRGCGPRIAAATLRYIAGIYGPIEDLTQDKVAHDYSTSAVSIRKWRDTIEDRAIEALQDADKLCYSRVPEGKQ